MEFLVKYWDGVKGNFVSKGFDWLSFWLDVNFCKGFSMLWIVFKNFVEVVIVIVGFGEFVEDSVFFVD